MAGPVPPRGGLNTLLACYILLASGSPFTSEQRAELKRALEQPQGFASYGDIRHWIAATFGVELTYNAVH